MWIDVVMVSVCVLHDPYDIPPSLLAFIMVVLGNGMRYGMRLFGEALTGSFAGAMIALSLRAAGNAAGITPGVMFLNLFGGIILIYAYILMSRIEASRQRLEEQSSVDTLTGLMNRRALFEAAHPLFDRLEGDSRLVVMFADLNKFKLINDTYGHATGDEVLRQFSGILRDCMRNSDIAARFGGDEFVVLLSDTSLEEARKVAERLRAQTAAWAERSQLDLGVTIGMGEAPTHGRDIETLLEQVDRAMYRSKADPNCIGVISEH
jgi:diguanylate cyclase (GGDEF)-like protein